MRFGRLSINFRSLRFRLLIWNTIVVLLMVVVTLLAVREGLRLTLIREMDQLLQEDALEIRLAVEQLYPKWDLIQEEINRKAIGHAHREFFIQVFDSSMDQVASSLHVPREAKERKADFTPHTLQGGTYRVATAETLNQQAPKMYVRVGSTLRFVNEDVVRLSRMSVWVAIALLPLASWGGWWLAGLATTPVAEISRMAARLRPWQLEERLPTGRTGDELDRLSRTINGLLDRIAVYIAQNREFIANAAHELRSPLAAIQSSVEVSLNADRTTGEYQELLYEIVEECGSLTGLVNQLLLLAETDATPVLPARDLLRLDHVVQKSLEMFRAAAEEKNIDLVTTRLDPITVRGEATRLWQVVNNLIDNALKFSFAGGRVTVDLCEDREHDAAILQVTDTGCGILPADLPHVFERFYQGDKSRQREQLSRGNGLGLSICQAIVDAHNGAIVAESAPGEGTRFTVTLPRTAALVAEPAETGAQPLPG